jgi:diacylglycerol kinase family enzyme
MPKLIVLLNSKSGASSEHEPPVAQLKDLFAAAGFEAEIRIVTGHNIVAEATRAAKSDADLIVAAGGDGTVSAVAGQLAGSDKVLGVLPVGTLNHFAKDLGIPLTLAEAVAVIADRHVETIDTAEVNGRVFINNSSVGLYPAMVLRRDAGSKAHGWSKWYAAAVAMVQVAIRFPVIDIRLGVDQSWLIRKTPIAFVGNNRYLVESSSIGKRLSLCDGQLSLYVARPTTRFRLIVSVFKTLLGRGDSEADLESFDLETCRMELRRRRRVHVAVDGEVVRMHSPLEYRIRRGDLQVCVPKRTEVIGASEADAESPGRPAPSTGAP